MDYHLSLSLPLSLTCIAYYVLDLKNNSIENIKTINYLPLPPSLVVNFLHPKLAWVSSFILQFDSPTEAQLVKILHVEFVGWFFKCRLPASLHDWIWSLLLVTYGMQINSLSSFSLMKCTSISTCFMCQCCIQLKALIRANLLSQHHWMANLMGILKYFQTRWIHSTLNIP